MELAASPLQKEVAQLQREVQAALRGRASQVTPAAQLSAVGSPGAPAAALRQVPAKTPPRRGAMAGVSPRPGVSHNGKPTAPPGPSAHPFTPREAGLLAELQAQRQVVDQARAALKAERSAAEKARVETLKSKKRAARVMEQLGALRTAVDAEQAKSAQLQSQLDFLTQQVEAEYGKSFLPRLLEKLEGQQQTVQSLKERVDAMKVNTAPLLGVEIAWASESPAAARVRAVESAMHQRMRQLEQKIAALEASSAPAAGPATDKPKSSLRLSPSARAAAHAAQRALDLAEENKELDRARAKFHEIDVDGSGALSRGEVASLAQWTLRNFLKNQHGVLSMTPERLDAETSKLLQQADTDGDGELSFEEFAAWFTPTCKRIQEFRNKQNLMAKQRRAQKMQARSSRGSLRLSIN